MFGFIKNYLNKQEGLKEYKELLKRSLADNKLDGKEITELKNLADKYRLKETDCEKAQRMAFSEVFSNMSSDQRITDEEKTEFEKLINHFDIKAESIPAFNQKNFNKYSSLASIEKGVMPKMNVEGFSLLYKKGEIMHYAEQAILVKIKKVVHRVNYHGLTASIKITKGLRYRAGSINIRPQTIDTASREDTGLFYTTNQRVGFLGQRKQFSLPYNKISSFELRPEGLFIFKEGKEAAYIVSMADYEVILAIISQML